MRDTGLVSKRIKRIKDGTKGSKDAQDLVGARSHSSKCWVPFAYLPEEIRQGRIISDQDSTSLADNTEIAMEGRMDTVNSAGCASCPD